MRTIALLVLWTMLYNTIFASSALAADPEIKIVIDNKNEIKAEGGKASSDQKQKQKQKQDQKQDQSQDASSQAIVQGNLPEVGFVSFMAPGTPIVGSEWKFYYSNLYSRLSVKKIEKMRYGFHFSDLWPGKWGGRVQFTLEGESLSANSDDISVMHYWPEIAANPNDEVLGTSIVVGEPDWSERAFLGEALAACKSETMTRRVAIAYSEYIDGVTVGASLGLSGSTAEASNGSGFVIASGAMVGKNKTRAERVARVKVLCMNDGPLYLPPTAPPPAPAPPVAAPPSEQVCDIDAIWVRIKIALKKIVKCTTWGWENLQHRRDAAEGYVEMYACTHEEKYLVEAIKHFGMAEKNYNHPKGQRSIRAHQREADAIMAKIYFDWAVAVKITKGDKAVRKFIRDHGLDMNPNAVPGDFTP